jgi:putative toxin-antitoxin system antitoxin component (TIGR02293 family)
MGKTIKSPVGSSKIINVLYWIGGERKVGHKIRSEMDYILVGEEGLTRESIEKLATTLGVSRKRMADDVLQISVKTIERKNNTDRFDAKLSSHVVEIAKIMQHTYEVFEDEEKVQRWINSPNRALNNQAPVDLMKTMTGLRMIDTILVRIEEGVYS